jgi:hypothetical protein
MKLNTQKVMLLFAGLFLLSMLSFAMAAKPSELVNGTAEESKNMTYGQCVSAAAEIKNTCFTSVKNTTADCGKNQTDKALKAQCGSDYKKAKSQCKTDFKTTKNECKKIKHNFFQTMRYSVA